ncbi:hypothetical protein CBL_04962 [Carabus blaptoides fortunei]
MEPDYFDTLASSMLHCHHLHQSPLYDNSYSFIPLPPTPPSPAGNVNMYRETPEIYQETNNQIPATNSRLYHYEPSYQTIFGINNTIYQKTSTLKAHNDMSFILNSDNSCGVPSPSSLHLEYEHSSLRRDSETEERATQQKLEESTSRCTYYDNLIAQNIGERDYYKDIKIKYPQSESIEWNYCKFDGDANVERNIEKQDTDQVGLCMLPISSPNESEDTVTKKLCDSEY